MKTLATIVSLILSISTGELFAQAALGLAERRALKEYQEKTYPELQKQIHAAAGFEVPIEIAWETIAIVGQAESYNEATYFTDVLFKPLIEAFKDITRDDEGKKALKAGLKKVVIKHDETSAPASNYPNGLKFEAGELSINWTPGVNSGDIKERTAALKSVLEPKL
jgi:hypothetical protein